MTVAAAISMNNSLFESDSAKLEEPVTSKVLV